MRYLKSLRFQTKCIFKQSLRIRIYGHDFYNLAGLPTVKVLVAGNDWEMDSWWGRLFNAHPFTAGIAKLEAHSYYDWHIDTDRGVRLNMLLNNWETSHSMFNPFMKRGESAYNVQLASLKDGEREVC